MYLGWPYRGIFTPKNPSSLVILDFKLTQTAKTRKTRYLRKTENGEAGSHICFTSHKVRTAEQKKVLKKRRAGGFFGPAVKNGRNYGPACLGLKMVEIQKFLFPQGFATLWPADG